ncbi:tetraacyldisaccharide 4'-kinase, partial [Candidatus Pelagibacter sp.]|nr:tetraacyldisaccharide 4'-kinase [Candidatus Pelagibacter sp.]
YLGGTGKTPLSKEIYKIAKSFGKNPSFIKKNYDYLSDEIKMLNEIGDVFTYKDRIKGIQSSVAYEHDVAILDDGFQDFSVKPNFSILCFNSKQMIGNGFLIPAGPLRERLNAISRADCIVINGEKNFKFEKKISQIKNGKSIPIFYSKYKIKNIENFINQEISAFAGIGNPSNFFELLRENGINLKYTFSFPDHHHYSEKDFEKIKNYNSTKIVTTEKDYYRMNESQKKMCEIVEIDLEIKNKNEFENILKNHL